MGLPTTPPGGFPRDMGPKPTDALRDHIKRVPAEQSRKKVSEVRENKTPAGRPKSAESPRVNRSSPSESPSRKTVDSSKSSRRVEEKPSRRVQPKVEDRKVENEPTVSDLPEGWAIDPKTGKKYKKLAGAPADAIKNGRKSGLSKEQLEAITVFDDDFNLDDLNASANIFMAHLRVPPDKDEQKRLAEDRVKKRRASDAAYKAAQEFLDEKDKAREEKAEENKKKRK